MSCNCNTADPNCEPCAICTPPGVTGLTTCKPQDPCDEKLDIGCAFYNGNDYPCYGVYNGASLYTVIFNLLGQYFKNCCDINGTISFPTTTTTSTTSTTTTSTTTTTTVKPTTTTTSSTTTTTTIFSCTCNYYDVTNPFSGNVTLTYTSCNNGYIRTTTLFGANTTTRVCACSDILASIPRGVTVINTGIGCTSNPVITPTTTTSTTTIMPCNCYRVTATNGAIITWVDCNGVTQTGTYNVNNPNYCSPYLSFEGTGYVVITGGTTPCINQLCPTTTTTTIPVVITTSTTTIARPCVPACGALYMTGNNSNLYFYNLDAGGTSTQVPNPSTTPVGAYGDIAHTGSQFFIVSNVGDPFANPSITYSYINVYNMSMCPITFSTSKKTLQSTAGKNIVGLAAKTTDTLIACRVPAVSTSSIVVEINTSGTTPVFTDKFSLDTVTTKVITGDLYYSADGFLYVTTQDSTNTTRWISKYNYSTGTLITDLSINSITPTGSAYALTAINNNIYIFLSTGGVYRVDNMTTLVQMPFGVSGIGSASTAPNCAGLTTTTTTLVPCTCLTLTSSNINPVSYSYTNCNNRTVTNTILKNQTLNICGVSGSVVFGSGEGTSVTAGLPCYDRKSCPPAGTTTTSTTTTPPTTTTTTKVYTTSTTSSTTSTTSTTSTSTTTTTTMAPCLTYTITKTDPAQVATYTYIPCNTVSGVSVQTGPRTSVITMNIGLLSASVCALSGSVETVNCTAVAGSTCTLTTSTTTNPYPNKYYASKYSCMAVNGCTSPPIATNIIVTVQNNTLSVNKYYLASGDPIGLYSYRIVSAYTGTSAASVVLNKLTETSSCAATCSYYNPNV